MAGARGDSFAREFLQYCDEMKDQLDAFERVKVVMGNPACDLDSAVSALVYAILCDQEGRMAGKNNTLILPMLNIQRCDLCLKTEVVYWMNEYRVPVDLLITRTDVDLKALHEAKCLQLVLVDHHVLDQDDAYLQSSVVEIYDHRPPQEGWQWEGKKTLVRVGSCCTLIAREVLNRRPSMLTDDVCRFLYGPVLLDTSCLSSPAGRTTELDLKMLSELDKRLHPPMDHHKTFGKLLDARSDISKLSPAQVLVKDMKIVNGVPVCGLPVLLQEFVKKPGISEALNEFCSQKRVSTMMLMGLKIDKVTIYRELAVYSASEPAVGNQFIEYLKESTNPQLDLQELVLPDVPGLVIFKQGNIKVSRKEIIPMVKAATNLIDNLGKELKP